MSADLPPLPKASEHQRYVCNKCGSVGDGDGTAHQRSDGKTCHYFGVSYGPFWTADQMHAYARSALAAQAAEVERLIAAVDEYRAHIITMGREKDAQIAAQAAEVDALRADAERYRTMLDNFDSLVLRTEKGSTLTLTAKQRGAKFSRRGTDATLDGLGAALKEQTPTSQQKEPTE